jgi:integrase
MLLYASKNLNTVFLISILRQKGEMKATNAPGDHGTQNQGVSDVDSSRILSQNHYSISEGLNAKRKPGDNTLSVVKHKAGRKRKGRSMGRYPFLTWAMKYLESVGAIYAQATFAELHRRYRRMSQDLGALFESGKVSTTNPEKISVDDILAYITYLKKRGMSENGILHNLGPLNNLLAYAGNPAVTVFKQRYRSFLPKKRMKRYSPMDESVRQRIFSKAEQMNECDWKRQMAYALVVLAICTGMRNKEIRLCKVTDLDLPRKRIIVEHVKGEGSYGQARPVAIRPEAIGIMEKYLRVRNKKVMEKCPNNLALFPALRDSEDGYFSSNGIRVLKSIVEKEMGVKFDLRTCRRTYGQMAIDEGLDLESVSVLMGHNTTKTTENYYCRKPAETAIKEAQNIWTRGIGLPGARTPKIDFRNEVTGYA